MPPDGSKYFIERKLLLNPFSCANHFIAPHVSSFKNGTDAYHDF